MLKLLTYWEKDRNIIHTKKKYLCEIVELKVNGEKLNYMSISFQANAEEFVYKDKLIFQKCGKDYILILERQ
jgi:hypothetical protein